MPNQERPTPRLGAWSDGRCGPGAGPDAWGGAGQGRRSDFTAERRKYSDPGAATQGLVRGSGQTMPVTGKTFRRRRADSESEEDEQDSEEVRCVWGKAFTGQEERDRLGGLTTGQTPC